MSGPAGPGVTSARPCRASIKNALVVLDKPECPALQRAETHLFFQPVSARHMKGNTTTTSNRSVRDRVAVFAGDEKATTAIRDRLVHRAHTVDIDSLSYRLKATGYVINFFGSMDLARVTSKSGHSATAASLTKNLYI